MSEENAGKRGHFNGPEQSDYMYGNMAAYGVKQAAERQGSEKQNLFGSAISNPDDAQQLLDSSMVSQDLDYTEDLSYFTQHKSQNGLFDEMITRNLSSLIKERKQHADQINDSSQRKESVTPNY